jgi:hypothetical protein
MKTKIALLAPVIFMLLFIGCEGTDMARFQKEAVDFASDNKIDQIEFTKLVSDIKASKEKGFSQFLGPDNEVDNKKLVGHLLKLFAAKKLALTRNDIWPPESEPVPAKFNVDVYIENSASMDGYVKGQTKFETSIYSLLGALKTSDLCDKLNLNYINRKITFTKSNVPTEEIQDFIEKLEPSTFKQMGGDRGTSDLSEILKTVIEKVDDSNLAILTSDFVFSKGKNLDSKQFLNNQTLGTSLKFHDKLQIFDLSLIVLQLESEFDGIYYDQQNKPITLKTSRPYYIWIVGSSSQIKSILGKKILNYLKQGYLNHLVFQKLNEPEHPDYKILMRPRIGEFELNSGAKGPITGAAVSRDTQNKGIFTFTMAVKFSESMQDSKYFLDPANYQLSDNRYTLTVEPVNESDQALKGFTHKLILSTKELSDEVLKIDVVAKTPGWIGAFSSLDDANIASDENEKHKTFGLKPVVDGVGEAFYPLSKENIMSTLSVSIKK